MLYAIARLDDLRVYPWKAIWAIGCRLGWLQQPRPHSHCIRPGIAKAEDAIFVTIAVSTLLVTA